MSQWIERINTHVIWGELKSLGIAIDLAQSREGNEITVLDGLERVRTVLAFCGKRLAVTDPILLEPRPLTSLASQISAARTEIEAYVTDGIAAHVAAANARADEVLAVLPSVLAPLATDDLTIINESISSYRNTLEKYMQMSFAEQQKIKEASSSNEEKLKTLETALTTEQQKLATLILEYQTQFSSAQDKRASEFSAMLADQQTKYAAATAEQQTQFSKDQDTRKSDYAESKRENQETFSNLIAEYTIKLKDQDKAFADQLEIAARAHETNLGQLITKYEASARGVLDEINTHKKEVEKLVGVIGNLGVTSGYQKVANLARTMLFVWQTVTVLALGGLIFVAYQMAFPPATKPASVATETPKTTSSTQSAEKATPTIAAQMTAQTPSDAVFYQGLATRVFLSLTFGIFAAYAARQASHFLEMERKNRKLALELEALGPYIAPLDKEKQDEFRLKIGDRSFGVHDNESIKPNSDDPVTAIDVLNPKDLGEFAASLAKGLK